MIIIQLNDVNTNIDVNNIDIVGLDSVNPRSLPLYVNNERVLDDFYSFLYKNQCFQSLSCVAVNTNTTEVLAMIVLSKGFQIEQNRDSCLILGCGMVKNFGDDVIDKIQNMLFKKVVFLLKESYSDDNNLRFSHFYFQPFSDEDEKTIANNFGLTIIRKNNQIFLSKKIYREYSINLGFLRNYLAL